MISETERQQLLADARRMVRETRFEAGLCLRAASEAEQAVRASEQKKIRERARRFFAMRGKPKPEPLPVGHTAQVIPFPIIRRPHLV